MTGGGAAPERGAGRPVESAGGISLFRRLWRAGRLLSDGAGAAPVHPLLRLYVRWVRRPLLPAMRLWRRNIQLRVVATTLLMSLGVVLLLGVVVIGQVRNGLLDAKRHASQSQAEGGFKAAREAADAGADGRGAGPLAVRWPGQPGFGCLADGPGAAARQWRAGRVQRGGAQRGGDSDSSYAGGAYTAGTRGPRASGDIDPEHSIPTDLRRQLDSKTGTYEKPGTVKRSGSDEGEPALVVGKRLYDVNGKPYQLYYLFPFTQEEKSLSLVKGTLTTAGVFVVVLLGGPSRGWWSGRS
ncbi:hypothetical protein GCM10020000_49650 [Streptomyces olivoverticillatus]